MLSSRYNSELVSVGYGTPPENVMRNKKKIQLLSRKYLSLFLMSAGSTAELYINHITDHFLCKADFILSKKLPHDTSNFYIAGFVKPQEYENWLFSGTLIDTCITPYQENNPCNRKGPRNCQMSEKRNSYAKYAWFARWHSVERSTYSCIPNTVYSPNVAISQRTTPKDQLYQK